MKKYIKLRFFVVSLLIVSLFSFIYALSFLQKAYANGDVVITPVEFTSNADFHTDLWKNYLNDNYNSVSDYANGDAEHSKPNPIRFSWDVDNNGGYTINGYTLSISEKYDFSEKWEFETTDTYYDVFNLKSETAYYWKVSASCVGEVVFESGVSTVNTAAGPRNMNIGGLTNVRDLGGWLTSDNTRVKQGLIYRSGALHQPNSTANIITSAGINTMLNQLGIKSEIDLRGEQDAIEDGGVGALGSTVNYYHVPMGYNDSVLVSQKDLIKRVFEILSDESNYPVVFHCAIGTDRTGCIAYLVNGLLGVAKQDLYRDYLLSNFGNIGGSRSIAGNIESNYVTPLDYYSGRTLQEKIYNYLNREIGVTTAQLDSVISILTDDYAGEREYYVDPDIDVGEINVVQYDVFDSDFAVSRFAGENYITAVGNVVLGDVKQEHNYSVKLRVYIPESTDSYNIRFILNSDGENLINGSYGGVGEFVITSRGALNGVGYGDGSIYFTFPKARTFYMHQIYTNSEMIKPGATLDIEVGEMTGYLFYIKVNGVMALQLKDGTGATPDWLFGKGTKLCMYSMNKVILQTSHETCVHEPVDSWSEPDANNAIKILCKHCGMVMDSTYAKTSCDLSSVAGTDSLFIQGSGNIGNLTRDDFVGLKARIYLPEDNGFVFKFSIMGDGTTLDGGNLYKGAFYFLIRNGSIGVGLTKSPSSVFCSALSSDIYAGNTVEIEFGVFEMGSTTKKFYFCVNGKRLIEDELEYAGNAPLGRMVSYKVNMGTLIETSTATCNHVAEGEYHSEENGCASKSCSICGKKLYLTKLPEIHDISDLYDADYVRIKAGDSILADIGAMQYVGFKGRIYIPTDAGNDFVFYLTLLSDHFALCPNQMYQGAFAIKFIKGQVSYTLPWASLFFTAAAYNTSAIKAGGTIDFEIVIKEMSDDAYLAYLYINDVLAFEMTYRDNNFAYGTYISIKTTTPLIFETSTATCKHEIGEWSAMDENFKQRKTCIHCGMIADEREIPTVVSFNTNFEGLVSLNDANITGTKQFTYTIPNVIGYAITDIRVDGVSVFADADELDFGYRITIQRTAVDISVYVVYGASSYNVYYEYSNNADITINATRIGRGGVVVYEISPKNNADIVKAFINGTDVTKQLVYSEGKYVLSVYNVKEDLTLSVNAEKVKYSVVVNQTEGGTVSVKNSNINAFGKAVFTIECEEGYYLKCVDINGQKYSSSSGELTVYDVNENLVVTPEFVKADGSADASGCSDSISLQNYFVSCVAILLATIGYFTFKRKEN